MRCGPTPRKRSASANERGPTRIAAQVVSGVGLAKYPITGVPLCVALSPADHRCTVFALRPAVCRLYGATEILPCPYGCHPEGGLLSLEEAAGVLADAMEAGGAPAEAQEYRQILKLPDGPALLELLLGMLAQPDGASERPPRSRSHA